jgi:hypothetical protein
LLCITAGESLPVHKAAGVVALNDANSPMCDMQTTEDEQDSEALLHGMRGFQAKVCKVAICCVSRNTA